MIHVYVGSDIKYLKDIVKREIKKVLNNEINEFNFITFDIHNCDLVDAVEECESMSFYAQTKCVVMENCSFLEPSGYKSLKKQDEALLIDYVKNQNPSTELYMLVVGKLIGDKKNKLMNAIKDKAEIIVKDDLNKNNMIDIGMSYIGLNSAEIDRESIEEVYERSKGDYTLFMSYLDKLLVSTNKIRLCDVEALIYKPLEDNVFNILESLFKGDIKKAISTYRDLTNLGQDAMKLFPVFASQLRFLYEVSYFMEEGKIDSQIVKELGCNPYRVKFARRSIGNLRSKTILRIMADLNDMEKHIKYDLDSQSTALELFMVNFKHNYLVRR